MRLRQDVHWSGVHRFGMMSLDAAFLVWPFPCWPDLYHSCHDGIIHWKCSIRDRQEYRISASPDRIRFTHRNTKYGEDEVPANADQEKGVLRDAKRVEENFQPKVLIRKDLRAADLQNNNLQPPE